MQIKRGKAKVTVIVKGILTWKRQLWTKNHAIAVSITSEVALEEKEQLDSSTIGIKLHSVVIANKIREYLVARGKIDGFIEDKQRNGGGCQAQEHINQEICGDDQRFPEKITEICRRYH